MAVVPFVPTHTVPAAGTRAWDTPDGTGAPAARLDPGLDVQVVERKDDWAKIVCSNGWQAWVDGRQLMDWVAKPEPTPAAPAGLEVRGLSIVSLVGAIAIAGGSFLDWWSFGPIGTSAWDIPIKYLFTGKAGDGLDTGPILLLLALVVAITMAIGRRLPSLVLLVVSALAMGIALAALIRGLTNDPTVYPEAGLLVTLAGGALVATDGFGLWSGRSR